MIRHIIANILSLTQYVVDKPATRPGRCNNCGCCQWHKHGCYGRKSDRSGSKLNPILIQRYRCCNCGKTCSVLPECIPSRRWYLWEIQQAILVYVLAGNSYRNTAKKYLPSRRTISRWINRFREQFGVYADTLKSFCVELGRMDTFEGFWKEAFHRWSLSRIMLILNNSGVIVP